MRVLDFILEIGTEAPGANERHWRTDAGLTLIFIGLTVLPHFAMMISGLDYGERYNSDVLILIAAWLFIMPLTLRRHYPLLMVVIAGAAGLAQVAVSGMPPFTVVAVPVMAYSVARWVEDDSAHLVLWIGLLGSVVGPAHWVYYAQPLTPAMLPLLVLAMVGCMAAVITPYAIGRRSREIALFKEEQELREEERRKAFQAQMEQRQRMAEINTRNAIAQELHDIVAHSLSVMIVQAEGGRALAAKKPEKALVVLDTIADTGREALDEMRRIVSVLRGDPTESADFGPTPTLADIPDLVHKTGPSAHLTIVGEPPVVSQALGLTAYRVVQEALTNVLKHAGPNAEAQVRLTYSATSIQIEVKDTGIGAAAASDGHGNGLKGMQERVASMGGRIQAEALAEGGFLVWALLPISSTTRTSPPTPM